LAEVGQFRDLNFVEAIGDGCGIGAGEGDGFADADTPCRGVGEGDGPSGIAESAHGPDFCAGRPRGTIQIDGRRAFTGLRPGAGEAAVFKGRGDVTERLPLFGGDAQLDIGDSFPLTAEEARGPVSGLVEEADDGGSAAGDVHADGIVTGGASEPVFGVRGVFEGGGLGALG